MPLNMFVSNIGTLCYATMLHIVLEMFLNADDKIELWQGNGRDGKNRE